MKKLLALCAGMMLIASAAMAQQGLHMSWVNCPNIAGNTSDQVFSCDPLEGAVYFLNGTFSLGVYDGLSAFESGHRTARLDGRFEDVDLFVGDFAQHYDAKAIDQSIDCSESFGVEAIRRP